MKTKPRSKYNPLQVKLTPYEQALEDATDELKPLSSTDPIMVAQVKAGFKELAVSLRGGKRLGAGRKPRESRRTVVLLAPAVRTRLEEVARRTGSLSSAVEMAVMALPR